MRAARITALAAISEHRQHDATVKTMNEIAKEAAAIAKLHFENAKK